MHLHFPAIVSESVNVTSFLRMRSLDRIFHCIQNWGFGFHAYNTCNQSSNFFPRNCCGCQLSGICVIVQLRLLEEKLQESEMRSRELEKQVASVGEGVSLESRHKLRLEQAAKQREAALIAAKEQSKDAKDEEIASLRIESQVLLPPISFTRASFGLLC
jgi:hypothetical protein